MCNLILILLVVASDFRPTIADQPWVFIAQSKTKEIAEDSIDAMTGTLSPMAAESTKVKTTASSKTTASMKKLKGGNSDQPNVLVLYADDLGFGDLGCYNSKSKIPTPNLDRLAKQGIRFTDGHSSSGICTPSRYALLTGRHHWRDFHGIVQAMGGSVFKPERITLPEMLKSKGYSTAAIGKWHLGWDWDSLKKSGAKPTGQGRRKVWGPDAFDWSKSIPDGPLAHGFDHYFGDTVINFPPYCWIKDDKVQRAPDTVMDSKKWKPIKEGNWECRPGPMISDWDPYQNIPTTTLEGIEFIHEAAKDDKPFFLYFAFPAPHAPIIPNDNFDGKSKAGPYGDLVVETDDACGRLLKALEETGQADNTIVIFTADNGPENYAYARDAKLGIGRQSLSRLKTRHLRGRPSRPVHSQMAGHGGTRQNIRRVGQPN